MCLLVSGAAAMVLDQIAFQAGPLSAGLPMIGAVDPLASVVIGVVVFDESMRHGPLPVVGLGVLLAALVVAVVTLSRVGAARGTAGRPGHGSEDPFSPAW